MPLMHSVPRLLLERPTLKLGRNDLGGLYAGVCRAALAIASDEQQKTVPFELGDSHGNNGDRASQNNQEITPPHRQRHEGLAMKQV